MLKINSKSLIAAALILVLVAGITLVSMSNRKTQDANMIVAVHVKGEVKNPGYYELEYGKRVKDAIEAAGGATHKADLDEINLAAKLRDGEEVLVVAKAERVSDAEVDLLQAELIQDGKVNINTASITELCSLDGIGESIASSVIEYRNRNGSFGSIEDIKKVSRGEESLPRKD